MLTPVSFNFHLSDKNHKTKIITTYFSGLFDLDEDGGSKYHLPFNTKVFKFF